MVLYRSSKVREWCRQLRWRFRRETARPGICASVGCERPTREGWRWFCEVHEPSFDGARSATGARGLAVTNVAELPREPLIEWPWNSAAVAPPTRIIVPLESLSGLRVDRAAGVLLCPTVRGDVSYRVLDVCGVDSLKLLCERADIPASPARGNV